MGLPFTKAFKLGLFPEDRLSVDGDLEDTLNKISALTFENDLVTSEGLETQISLEFSEELKFDLLGIDGCSVVFGGINNEALTFTYSDAADTSKFSLVGGLRLEIDPTLLRPATYSNNEWIEDPAEETLRIAVESGVTIKNPWIVEFEGSPIFTLKPFFVADSGIVVEAKNISLYFSDNAAPPPGTNAGFKGIYVEEATLHLPDEISDILPDGITVEQAAIGNGGFSGAILLDWKTERGILGYDESEAKSLFGFRFTLQLLEINFKQNALIASSIKGFLKVPFFDDVLKIEVGLTNDSDFTVAIASDDGSLVLRKPGVISVEVSSFEFVKEDDEFLLKLSGKLTPEVGDLDWPSFDLQGLAISSDGRVRIDGGWLDLPEPKALDLFGFRMEISQIGFGNEEDERRWVGFSGGVHLVDMLPTGVSVEGLRVIWDPTGARDPEIKLQGVGIELTVPGVLQLDGDVALINAGNNHGFEGNARLDLLPLGIGLDASVKIGRDTVADYKYVYTFLSLQLPIGIPLWATGAALYGISGLYGMNVTPTTSNGDWYAWYAGLPEEFNVTNSGKWEAEQDGRAFGAGMVLGTLFDMGYVVSAKALFAMLLPGPVILLNGKANVLQLPLPKLNDTSEGVFDALAVLDAQAGDLQLNIDAGWSLGKVIDIHAGAEAYFDFANPRNWHLYLGQDKPDDRRIRAYVIALFHADAYLMIDSDGIAAGFGVNWGQDWKFGPVKVVLRSWIEAGAGITWQPPQLEGRLSLGGEFEISVAGFGVGLEAEATLSGKAPTLYWVRGALSLRVKLPAPIKDLEETITLEWKEEATPASVPLVSVGLEHLKVDETWTSLVNVKQSGINPDHPEYDAGPIVPLDARPAITFDRPMKDKLADAARPVDISSVNVYAGATRIGDHEFEYEVQELTLDKWSKAGGKQWMPVENLYGAWMAIEDGNGDPAASKLQLWTKSPFEFTRRSSRTYRDAFLNRHRAWPCVEVPEQVVTCIDWEEERIDTRFVPVFKRGGLSFILGADSQVGAHEIPECATERALKLADEDTVWIVFPEPVRNVEICLTGSFVSVSVYSNGFLLEQRGGPSGRIVFNASEIDSLKLERVDNVYLARICYETEASAALREATQEHLDRIVSGLTHWQSEDQILEPETWYHLAVQTETVRTYKGKEFRTSPPTRHVYFQTAGPPGLTPQWALPDVVVANSSSSEADVEDDALAEKPYPEGGQLTDAGAYVQWPIPADGAAPVYRAYDIGVEFNENYVEQMYGADMVIELRDANDSPVLDTEGNEVSFLNQWAEVPSVELTEAELPYVTRVANCIELPGYSLPSNQKIMASPGILLEEDFSGDLNQWTDVNANSALLTSHWAVLNGKLKYTTLPLSNVAGLLLAGDEEWTDYAVEVELSAEGDEVGIVFRYSQTDVGSYYRLHLNVQGRYLERISGSDITRMWQDKVAYVPGDAHLLAIQCKGTRLRGQVDDELLFDLHDEAALLSGKVGIYTGSTAAFEHFLVREWPGGALAPQTMYSAELLASFVLFQGGLTNGWTDANFNWNKLTRGKSRIATIGREDWENYRVEMNVRGERVGAVVRFLKHPDGTFTCYRFIINSSEETVRFARLNGTYRGNKYELNATGITLLWSCQGAGCGIDFNLDEHDLALTCDGSMLIIEVDGQELHRVIDPSPLASGQAGLYYDGDDSPDFSELVIRSAPRQPVYHWSFITSQYEGLVELMDTFTGQLHSEEVSGVDAGELRVTVREAMDGMRRTSNAFEAARQNLESAKLEDVALLRSQAQQAAAARNEESVRHFNALYELLFESRYRATPPLMEMTALVWRGGRGRALLLESPEPLDWSRLNAQLSKLSATTNRFEEMEDVTLVWNDDGTKVFLFTRDASLPAGEYRLHLDYRLDLGAEAPLLRRNGSTLPEAAALFFTASETTNS